MIAVDTAQGHLIRCDRDRVQSKWNSWKKMWKAWLKHLGHTSGWGRCTDPQIVEIGLPITSVETMATYYRVNGSYRNFKVKFPA